MTGVYAVAEGHRDVLPLPDTRVPIVKFKERDTYAAWQPRCIMFLSLGKYTRMTVGLVSRLLQQP